MWGGLRGIEPRAYILKTNTAKIALVNLQGIEYTLVLLADLQTMVLKIAQGVVLAFTPGI
jgi:hypothetical protein